MMENVINEIINEKIIVIVRGVERKLLLELADALYDGGIRLMEITYTADRPEKDKETAETIRALAEKMNGKMYIGAGTVTRNEQVTLTKNAGGKFIISPDTNPELIAYTKKLGLVSIPGALTPSEISLASRSGADFVKLFPASVFGPSYVKTIKAPLSNVRILAVGGVNPTTMPEYAKAGACGFGIGMNTNLATPAMIEARDFSTITESTRKFVEMAKSL